MHLIIYCILFSEFTTACRIIHTSYLCTCITSNLFVYLELLTCVHRLLSYVMDGVIVWGTVMFWVSYVHYWKRERLRLTYMLDSLFASPYTSASYWLFYVQSANIWCILYNEYSIQTVLSTVAFGVIESICSCSRLTFTMMIKQSDSYVCAGVFSHT